MINIKTILQNENKLIQKRRIILFDRNSIPSFDGRSHPYKIGDIIEVTRDGITRDAIVTKLLENDVELMEFIPHKKRILDKEQYEYVLAKMSLKFKERADKPYKFKNIVYTASRVYINKSHTPRIT